MLEVVQHVRVVSSEALRGIVSFSLRISDKSTVTQEIVMDAMCPYLKFNTEVLNNNCRNWRNLENHWFNNPPISGEVGGVSQVPQGRISCASTQPQCYLRDPVWPSAKTYTQEHFMGLGPIWGTALGQLYGDCSTKVLTNVMLIMASFTGLGSQMGWFVRAQIWSCTAEWLQIWLFRVQEHNDTVPVRFSAVHF